MFSWMRRPAPPVVELPQPPAQEPPDLKHLEPLLRQLKVARSPRTVRELLQVAAHYPLDKAERAMVLEVAMEALAKVPSGSAYPRSSRSRNQTARSTKTQQRRR